jgi:hypothetical protein
MKTSTTHLHREDERLARGMAMRLRALRLAGGYPSAAAYARFLGVPAATVRRCEAGRLIASSRVYVLARAIDERVGASMDWFILGNAYPGAPQPSTAADAKVVIFPYWHARRGGTP